MYLFKDISAIELFIANQKAKGRRIGFVPTMGALHQGHLSLIEQCKRDGNLVIASVFVNPTQFNQPEDFEMYPRKIERDMHKLTEAGCDVLFHPTPEDVYPNGFSAESYDFGRVTNSLEGEHRPGHFNGVITIVKRLFELVRPDHAYFGRKDFQQCAVVAHLTRHFGFEIKLHFEDIIREAGGLAMSSRNERLSETERKDANQIFKTLKMIKENYGRMDINELKKEAAHQLSAVLKPEYVEIIDESTFEPVTSASISKKAVALIAAWCGNVRLIDNMVLGE